jgi:hypothetical protein
MTFSFQKFFFGLFPWYYKQNDTVKNLLGEGTLERYLQVPGEDIDDNIIPAAEDYMKIVSVIECDQRFLNHIAYALGNPPDIILSETLYRKLLRYIIDVYKIKGTIRAYELLFNLLGYNVTITEYPCDEVNYDMGLLYDDGHFYDTGCCGCSDYDIGFSNQSNICTDPTTFSPVSQTTLLNLRKIVFFIEPINTQLRYFTLLLTICELTNWCFPEELSWETRNYLLYDTGALYDDGNVYDTYVVAASDVYTRDACNLPPILAYIRQENFGLIQIDPTLGGIPVE